MDEWKGKDARVRSKISKARKNIENIIVPDSAVERAAELCMSLGTDGLRGELTLIRAARAVAALDGKDTVGDSHLKRVAPSALRHRLRRDPLDDSGSTVRVERALEEHFG